MRVMSSMLAIIERDLRLALRNKGEWINPLLFFVIIISLFPMAVSPESQVLRNIAPGVIWVAALLATLLSMDRMFRSDFDDGSLEQMLLSPKPLTMLVLGKITAHWLLTGLPLIIISPLLGMMLNLPAHSIWALMLSLLLGTPILSLIGSIGIALTVGLRGAGMLLSLLILPLYIPVLIFGASTVIAALSDLPLTGYYALLGAMLALAFTLVPFATAAALRVGAQT